MESKPVFIRDDRGINVQYQNQLLYPTVSPQRSVLDRISRLRIDEKTLIFLPSPVLGFGLKELLDKLPSECHILSIEVDQNLMKIFQENAPLNILSDDRLTAVRTEDIAALTATLESIGMNNYRRIQPLYLNRGYHLNKHLYDNMRVALENKLRFYWQNKMTLIRMASLWMRNLIENLALLPSLKCFSVLQTDKPIVVTGAGPSLEEGIAILRRIRSKIVLCAVDTALPVLYQASLIPDFVFVLDSQLANMQDFTPCASIDTRLICDLTTHPTIMRKFHSKTYLYASRFFPLAIFDRMQQFTILPTVFPPLGSVGVAAVYAALKMTSGPILITGLDFSYRRGFTHAKGTPFHLHLLLSSQRVDPLDNTSYRLLQKRPLLWQIDACGNKILSDLILTSYAHGLSEIIKDAGRVYYMGNPGMPVGAPQITTEAQLTPLLTASTHSVDESSSHGYKEKDVVEFIENEKRLLMRTRNMITSTLNDRESEKHLLSQYEKSLLEDVAYAYLSFPDQIPITKYERSLFKRALVSTTFFLTRLDRTLHFFK